MMSRGGDERAGYEVEVDHARKLLILRVWGFWHGRTLVDPSNDAIVEGCEILHATGAPWYLLTNATESPPQSPEVQAEIMANMSKSVELGVTRIATVLNGAVTKLQLRRLGVESGYPIGQHKFFNNEAEALRWLFTG